MPLTKTRYAGDGQLQFRLVCSNVAAAGLIGPCGSIVKRLCEQTSSFIDVDKNAHLPDDERLVTVTGSATIDRKLKMNGEEFPASAAVEAVLRVLERLIEAEAEAKAKSGGKATAAAKVECKFLVADKTVGVVMGKGGERINKVTRESGAIIEVSDSRPFGVGGGDHTDRQIMIRGGRLAVKKALLLVLQHLQAVPLKPVGRAHDTISSGTMDQSKKIETRNAHVNISVNGKVEVIFKLLCPYGPSGFVIGPKGMRVKALQEETGASIFFSAPGAGCNERLVTISAFENRKMQSSVAQNAIVRVFDQIVSFSSDEGDTVSARLLIQPNQSDWLSAGEVPKISVIQHASGAALKVWELNYTPVGASADEKVLEIDGEYHNVQAALFQVSWELRECAFETSLAKNNNPLLTHELLVIPSICSEIVTIRDDMKKCSVSDEYNCSPTQISRNNCWSTSPGSPKDLSFSTISTLFDSGNTGIVVTNAKLEIAVRADMFNAVYGDNDCNISRLRLISGANVEVHNPCSGNEGIVIISGTRDETLVAQSLLQAFLMSAR